MEIFEKRQSFNKENIGKQEKALPSKEEKKDTSIFGGKPSLRREEVRGWLRKEESWKMTKMPLNRRIELEKKLFDPGKFGQFIQPKEAMRVYEEIKNFPTRSKEKYKINNEGERLKILNLLEKKFLRK